MEDAQPPTSSLLEQARDLAQREAGLAVVVTYRSDGTGHASVVNAAVVDHPVSGERAVAFVVQGGGDWRIAERLRALRPNCGAGAGPQVSSVAAAANRLR